MLIGKSSIKNHQQKITDSVAVATTTTTTTTLLLPIQITAVQAQAVVDISKNIHFQSN